MTTEARFLFDELSGWILWIAYFGGVLGCWAWLIIVARNCEAKAETIESEEF